MVAIYRLSSLILASVFVFHVAASPVVRPVSDLSPKHLLQCGDSFYNATTSSCVNNDTICPFVGDTVVNTTLPQSCNNACSSTVPASYICENGLLQKTNPNGRRSKPLLEGVPLPSFAHPYDHTGSSVSSISPAGHTVSSEALKRDNITAGYITGEDSQNQSSSGSTTSSDDKNIASEDNPVPVTPPTDSDIPKKKRDTVITIDDSGAVTQQAGQIHVVPNKPKASRDNYQAGDEALDSAYDRISAESHNLMNPDAVLANASTVVPPHEFVGEKGQGNGATADVDQSEVPSPSFLSQCRANCYPSASGL